MSNRKPSEKPSARTLEFKLLEYAQIDPPAPRWMVGDDADAGPSYCQLCAERAVASGLGEGIDGGYDAQDSDGCCLCDTCGCLLDYNLTDYGVRAEIDHYRKARWRKPPSKEDAFHIARILERAPNDADAIRIAAKAVEALTKKPEPTHDH